MTYITFYYLEMIIPFPTLNLSYNISVLSLRSFISVHVRLFLYILYLGSRNWCTRDELQVLVPLINQNQTEKSPGLEDLTKVYINRVLDYMITQVRFLKSCLQLSVNSMVWVSLFCIVFIIPVLQEEIRDTKFVSIPGMEPFDRTWERFVNTLA